MSGAWVYILECADKSFYTGLTKQTDAIAREWEHNNRIYKDAYTSTRLPVKLVYAEHFESITDAIETEQKIKGWGRAKKIAMINGDWNRVVDLSKRRGGN